MVIMKKCLIILVAVLSMATELPAQANKSMFILTGGKKTVQLPFTCVNNLVVVSARLNGHTRVNLMLDTGSPSNLITDPRISNRLSQAEAKQVTFSGPGSGRSRIVARVLTGLTVEMEGIKGEGIAMVATLKRPALSIGTPGVPVHGVLGYPFFTQFVVTIDYANLLLTFTEANNFIPPFEALAIPISLADSKPVLSTSLSGGWGSTPNHLLLDTGGFHELIIHEKKDGKLRNQLPVGPRENLGTGFGGAIYGRRGIFSRLWIGPLELGGVQVLFPEKGQYHRFPSAYLEPNGSIGGGLLREFVVTIDYIRETVYLQQPGEISKVAKQSNRITERALLPGSDQ